MDRRQVETINWQNPGVVAFEQKHPQFRPRMFLRLLTYAYASGTYASEDIATVATAMSARGLRERPPTATRNCRVSQRNRGLLQWFLMELFKHAISTSSGR